MFFELIPQKLPDETHRNLSKEVAVHLPSIFIDYLVPPGDPFFLRFVLIRQTASVKLDKYGRSGVAKSATFCASNGFLFISNRRFPSPIWAFCPCKKTRQRARCIKMYEIKWGQLKWKIRILRKTVQLLDLRLLLFSEILTFMSCLIFIWRHSHDELWAAQTCYANECAASSFA